MAQRKINQLKAAAGGGGGLPAAAASAGEQAPRGGAGSPVPSSGPAAADAADTARLHQLLQVGGVGLQAVGTCQLSGICKLPVSGCLAGS